MTLQTSTLQEPSGLANTAQPIAALDIMYTADPSKTTLILYNQQRMAQNTLGKRPMSHSWR